MAIMASWQGMRWEVSTRQIKAIENLTTTYKLKSDTNADAAGKPATNVRALELQPLRFVTKLSDAAGVNVAKEIEAWGALVGEAGPFLLGGKQFGPDKLRLNSVTVASVVIDNDGRMRMAQMTLDFIEASDEASKDKPTAIGASSGTATVLPGVASASSYAALGISSRSSDNGIAVGVMSAVSIGARAADKISMAPKLGG